MNDQVVVAIGVDIGGTKIAAALIDTLGNISHRQHQPTPTTSAEILLETVVDIIQAILKDAQLNLADIAGIGLGVPGKVDAENGLAIYQNNLPWANFPVVEKLQAIFPNTKIAIDNDVKVAALAEYRDAALKQDEIFTYLTISTGIASTTLINNKILRGAGFSGEVGFFPTGQAEPFNTLEKLAAGPGIQRKAHLDYQNDTITTAEVFADWQQQTEPGFTIVEESIKELAQAIYHMVCYLDPTAITLGGSVVLKNPHYLNSLNKYLQQWLHPEQEHILERITLSIIGSDNGLLGSAWLVID